MYGTGAVLALDEQRVRLQLLLLGVQLMTLIEAVIGVRCAILVCEYTAPMIMALH